MTDTRLNLFSFSLFSDEEDENDQLLFLTITPEFDEVEEPPNPTEIDVSPRFLPIHL